MSVHATRSAHPMPTLDAAEEQREDERPVGNPDDTAEPEGQFPDARHRPPRDTPDSVHNGGSEHEGGTEEEVGDRTGPGAGYDQEPEQESDRGGVA